MVGDLHNYRTNYQKSIHNETRKYDYVQHKSELNKL